MKQLQLMSAFLLALLIGAPAYAEFAIVEGSVPQDLGPQSVRAIPAKITKAKSVTKVVKARKAITPHPPVAKKAQTPFRKLDVHRSPRQVAKKVQTPVSKPNVHEPRPLQVPVAHLASERTTLAAGEDFVTSTRGNKPLLLPVHVNEKPKIIRINVKPPKLKTGAYLSTKASFGKLQINDIENIQNSTSAIPTPSKTSQEHRAIAWGLGLGYQFPESSLLSRWELEYLYHTGYKYSTDAVFESPVTQYALKSKLVTHTLFFNLYHDFTNFTVWHSSPYIEGGLGLSHNIMTTASRRQSNTNSTGRTTRRTDFAWNAGLGIKTILAEDLSLDIGYRYTNLGNLRWKIVESNELSSNRLHDDSLFVQLNWTF